VGIEYRGQKIVTIVIASTLMFAIFCYSVNKALNLILLNVKLGQGMLVTKQQ